jgi:hypothetical protein
MLLFRIDCVGGLRLNETESRRVERKVREDGEDTTENATLQLNTFL